MKNWTRLGVTTLSLLADTYWTFPPKSLVFHEKEIMDGTYKLKSTRSALQAVFLVSSLNTIPPKDIGSQFPVLERLIYMLDISAQNKLAYFPDRRVGDVAVFQNVKCLDIEDFSCLPNSFEWIWLFFPNVSELHIGNLPIRKGLLSSQLGSLEMKSVEKLVLGSRNISKAPVPLFENLKLFPNLKILEFSGPESEAMLREMIKGNATASSIKCFKIYEVPASLDILVEVMEKFPQLEELCISEETFSRLMVLAEIMEKLPLLEDPCASKDGPSEIFTEVSTAGPDRLRSLFERLTKLGVDCDHKRDVCFYDKVNKMFPSVREIEIARLPLHHLLDLPREGEACSKITKITIAGECRNHPPSFFKLVFPALESLVMARCRISSLFSGDMARDRTFFAHLKHLDISHNGDILHRVAALEELLLMPDSQVNPSRESEAGSSAKGDAMAPLAPELESLDISGNNSGHSNMPPCWFFQAFPNINKLRASDELFLFYAEDGLRELLIPLKKLRQIDVKFFDAHLLRDSTMPVIIEMIGRFVESCTSVTFFTEHSPRPFAGFCRAPGAEEWTRVGPGESRD